jgi:two-component system phosphate regulon response regulator PhoB
MTKQPILEVLAPSAPVAPMDGRLHSDDFPVRAGMQMLRLADDLRSVYAMQKRVQQAPIQKRKRVLVVDDQDDIRRLICMTVQFEDYEVFEADSGDTGLAMALELKPDLVMLDVLMPGALDGLHVCRAIKAMPDPPRVLLLTGQGGRARRDAGHKAGADAYLLKPFSPLQLIAIINEQLGTA